MQKTKKIPFKEENAPHEVNAIVPDYFLLVNSWAIGITIHDKHRAQKGGWRIPESTLLLIAAIGGAPGMYLTMKKIRHKTQKKKFMIGIPLLFFLQIVILTFFYQQLF